MAARPLLPERSDLVMSGYLRQFWLDSTYCAEVKLMLHEVCIDRFRSHYCLISYVAVLG